MKRRPNIGRKHNIASVAVRFAVGLISPRKHLSTLVSSRISHFLIPILYCKICL